MTPHTNTPHWVDTWTQTSGLPNPRLAGTTTRPRTCRTCGALTLTGYDAPLAAELATCDPYRLTPHHETAAILLGIPTWQLWGTPGSYEITRRTPNHINGTQNTPADKCTVLATHRCGMRPISTDPIPTHPTRTTTNPDRIPF